MKEVTGTARSVMRQSGVQAWRLIAAAPIMLFLAACGGGGSGGGVNSTPAPTPSPSPTPTPTPTPTPFTSWQAAPSNGNVALSGSTIEASYTSAQFSSTTYSTAIKGNTTLNVTTSAGKLTGAKAEGSLSTVTFVEGDGSTLNYLAFRPSVIQLSSANNQSKLLAADPSQSSYNYMTYGAWITGLTTGSGYVASYMAGAPTAGGSVPTSGTATYKGTAIGVYTYGQGSVDLVTSVANISANFTNRSLSLSLSDTRGNSSHNELTISGTLTYSSGSGNFSGGVVSTTSNTTISGTAQGSFFGPAAQEVAGTFLLTGSTSSGRQQFTGSFGGKQ
jgi:hypothetical protein